MDLFVVLSILVALDVAAMAFGRDSSALAQYARLERSDRSPRDGSDRYLLH